jgi:hypothetical protein
MMAATTYIMIVCALIWIVWDIILFIQRKEGPRVSTISMIITSFSWYSPALPLIAGILMGHWFWPA